LTFGLGLFGLVCFGSVQISFSFVVGLV